MSDEKKNYFDEAKKQVAIDWFTKKWPLQNRACEVCSSSNWSLSEDLVTPVALSAGSLMLGGRSYPQLMLICKNCGNTKYFNAVIMGIVSGEKDEGK